MTKISLINANLMAKDGTGACVINQARFFKRRGDEVRIYVTQPPTDVPPDVKSLTRVVTLGDLMEGSAPFFLLSDLYIYHYPGYYELIEAIRGIDRGTAVFYYHNVTPPKLWGNSIGREWLARSVRGVSLAHYADLCIVDSPFNKQDLIEQHNYASERIHVLPLAVDLHEYTPGEKNPRLVRRHRLRGKRVILYVGRMAGNKRIDLLVEALPKVKERVPNVKLLLVGDNKSVPAFRPIVATAQARANELGVGRDVVWTGRVNEVAPYFRLADVYATASLHEGFGVPLIEAMASGVPVVASRSGAMPWVLGDAGLLFEPEDVDDLADKTVSALQDRGLRRTLAERGLERVRIFGLERHEARLSEILEQALSSQESSRLAGAASSTGKPGTPRPDKESSDRVIVEALAEDVQEYSDIALLNYQVRSQVPLLGGLIVWIRRNLTSHLREPYLDPIIERQVFLNGRVAEWMRRVTAIWGARDEKQAELEARVEALEAQVKALLQAQGKQRSADD